MGQVRLDGRQANPWKGPKNQRQRCRSRRTARTRRASDSPAIEARIKPLLISVSLTNLFSDKPLESISASYYAGGWSQSFFVGFLFAIAAFLLSYNGKSVAEMVLSKVAALAAFGVAMFPCRCDNKIEIVRHVHGISAAVMFLILAYFCLIFYQRAKRKGHTEAVLREVVYAACGIAILLAILTAVLNAILGGAIKSAIPRLTFYYETVALVAFGISWLTASRTLPLLTSPQERFSPLDANAKLDDPPTTSSGAV